MSTRFESLLDAVDQFLTRNHQDDLDQFLVETFGARASSSSTFERRYSTLLLKEMLASGFRQPPRRDFYASVEYLMEEYRYMGRREAFWLVIIVTHGEADFGLSQVSRAMQVGEQVAQNLRHRPGAILLLDIASERQWEKRALSAFCESASISPIQVPDVGRIGVYLSEVESLLAKARVSTDLFGWRFTHPVDCAFLLDCTSEMMKGATFL
jgi:hypothetical protein